jgi:DNA polymerase-1
MSIALVSANPTAGRPNSLFDKVVLGMAERAGLGQVEILSIDHYRATEQLKHWQCVVGLGKEVLTYFTTRTAIGDWRGSQLRTATGIPFLPTYDPLTEIYGPSERWLVQHDMKRALKAFGSWDAPPLDVLVPSSVAEVATWLQGRRTLSVDIETKGIHIASVALGTAKEVLVVPFLKNWEPYWSPNDELQVILMLRDFLQREPPVGQNYKYDAFYLGWYWHFKPKWSFDTLIAQHVLFPGEPKDLSYLASLYCQHYVYWKDAQGSLDEELWAYNARDVAATWEIAQAQRRVLEALKLEDQRQFVHTITEGPVLEMEWRGIGVDKEVRKALKQETKEAVEARQSFLDAAVEPLGFTEGLNVRSSKQMLGLFNGILGLPVRKHKKTRNPTAEDTALESWASKEPLVKPLTGVIVEIRTLGNALDGVLAAPIDDDGRMRCSFNTCGTETFRFSSSKSSFRTGTNLQNITGGDVSPSGLELPNLRRLFVPEPGWMIVDADLERADLQIVAWEAGATKLKEILRSGQDVHTANAKALFDTDNPTPGERHFAKTFVHGTNYGTSARTAAIALKITIAKAHELQQRWFTAHPEIRAWHRRVEASLKNGEPITNVWGFRRLFRIRDGSNLPEALAWGPQSTVAITINHAMMALWKRRHEWSLRLLLQVHDSITFTLPVDVWVAHQEAIHQAMLVPLPYADPLTIGVSFKTSQISWGYVK